MRLIVDQSFAMSFIPIITLQQRASLPFKPGVLEMKVNNYDDITFVSVFFSVTHCHTRAWRTIMHGKACFILLLNLYPYKIHHAQQNK